MNVYVLYVLELKISEKDVSVWLYVCRSVCPVRIPRRKNESRIGLYAWLPARLSPRLVFFTRDPDGTQTNVRTVRRIDIFLTSYKKVCGTKLNLMSIINV